MNRIDHIGQNGATALHYVWQDLEAIGVKPSIELCERVLELRGASWRESFKRECESDD